MICPYCEKERKEINSWGSIDNRFDYACNVCNLEYSNWLSGKPKHAPYGNPRLDKEVKEELERDKKNRDTEWPSHLKTIAECSAIYVRACKEYGGDGPVPRHLTNFAAYEL